MRAVWWQQNGTETEVFCGKCPCNGSPWVLTGQEFDDYSLLKILQRPGAGRPFLFKRFRFVFAKDNQPVIEKEPPWKRSVTCEHWCFEIRLRERSDSVLTVTEEGWGCEWRSSSRGGHFRCRRRQRGGNSVSFSIHFIPFLTVPF